MPLKDLISEDRVVILAGPRDRGAVLQVAARLLAPDDAAQAEALLDILGARERLASTAIGHGVAIPHGRIGGIEHTRGAFLRLEQPADFGAADGVPVDLVLAMAVPEHHAQEHLQQLAELAERFADPEFRRRLRLAADADELADGLLTGDQRRDAA